MFVTYTGIVGAESQDWCYYLPPQEEPAVLRDFCEVKLQLREAVPVARPEVGRVRLEFILVSVNSVG